MGLLSKLSGKVPAKKATDDVLLLHGMLLMAGADGGIDHEEFEMVESFCVSLPEFRGKDLGNLWDECNKLVKKHGGVKESINILRELSTENLRKKCFILAADIAMSSGDVDDSEDKMLESMQRVLGVDDAVATQVLEVLSMKYAN